MKTKVKTFIGEAIILIISAFSAFWILITSVSLLPQIAKGSGQGSLTTLLYCIGTVLFSYTIIYYGMYKSSILKGGKNV